MENILSRIDCEFDAGFLDLNHKSDIVVKEENKFDVPFKNDPHDLLSDMSNFTSMKNAMHDPPNFSDADFKYLLSKSPPDEMKKSSKSKKETEEEEREKMQ